MRFYIDEYVPRAIVEGLRLRGVDILTAQDDGLEGFEDAVILDRATTLDRLLYTEDADILAEADARTRKGIPFHGIVYGHPLGSSLGNRLADLTRLASQSASEEHANRVEILPL